MPPELIELYRRDELLELHPSDWHMALLIFKEMGWTPERPIEAYIHPLPFVQHREAEAMGHAGQALFSLLNDEPITSTAIQMDLGLFYSISDFVGRGTFIVGRKGDHAKAKQNGDF